MLTVFSLPEELEQDFPHWKRLHGFWWTLPNFNPHTASSEPGQDLAADALFLIQHRGQDDDNNSGGNGNEDVFGADGDPIAADDDDGTKCDEPVCF